MILVDTNVLIYAVDADSIHHSASRAWLESALSGTDRVGFAWIVVLAFLRITTHRKIMVRPLSPEDAIAYVDSWLEQPFSELIGPRTHHWPLLRNLLHAAGTAGNLTSDAHLAALALENGAVVCSTDNDFRRYPGIEQINPLLSAGD